MSRKLIISETSPNCSKNHMLRKFIDICKSVTQILGWVSMWQNYCIIINIGLVFKASAKLSAPGSVTYKTYLISKPDSASEDCASHSNVTQLQFRMLILFNHYFNFMSLFLPFKQKKKMASDPQVLNPELGYLIQVQLCVNLKLFQGTWK